VAPADGVVKFTGGRSNFGCAWRSTTAYGIYTRYGHLLLIKVSMGQKISRGQVIALVGQSGRATGPHLHYECTSTIQLADPLNTSCWHGCSSTERIKPAPVI